MAVTASAASLAQEWR